MAYACAIKIKTKYKTEKKRHKLEMARNHTVAEKHWTKIFGTSSAVVAVAVLFSNVPNRLKLK